MGARNRDLLVSWGKLSKNPLAQGMDIGLLQQQIINSQESCPHLHQKTRIAQFSGKNIRPGDSYTMCTDCNKLLEVAH